MIYQIIQDDILNWTKEYKGEPYHAIFADPPYHLTSITKRFGKPGSAPAKGGVYRRSSAGFMSQSWDGTDESGTGIAFRPETWAALSQHLHPGGFVMAFAGTRGYHRMACAMEDSGLIIHPAMVWVFLSGFCKATRIDTQVDKAAGVEREPTPYQYADKKPNGTFTGQVYGSDAPHNHTAPATPLAQTWAGHRYGLQALKPSLEFLAVAQKPYEGKPVDCITGTGAGAWNIEAGRIPGPAWKWGTQTDIKGGGYGSKRPSDGDIYAEDIESDPGGRWPANLLLSEEGAALLDAQSGESVSREGHRDPNGSMGYHGGAGGTEFRLDGYNDSGGASRMFFQSNWQYEILEQLENADPLRYEPKVSSSEGNAGVEDFYWAITPKGFERVTYEEWQTLDPKKRTEGNIHPTKKPISLCKYLCELISPPDAYAPRRLLVPFSGSGSEMIGAVLSGKWEEITGIDSGPDYHEISKARLAWWSQWPGWGQTDVDKILASLGDEASAEQLSLFEAL